MAMHKRNMVLHGKLDHDSIIKLQKSFLRDNAACLIMPLVENKPPVLNAKYLHQLAQALRYLAKLKVCHNDIKWTNIGYDK
jgi:serine/threonine protein kinase